MSSLLVAVGLAACGSNSSSSSTNAANRLTMTTFGELTTLDSADYDDVPSSDMMGQIFEGLYRVAANNKVELGMAAQEPKVSEDGLVYTFTLRDAKWSDGSPVKAQDFVFTYRKLVNPQEGHVAQSADVFKNAKKIRSGELPVEELGVKALDDKTLEITLENPAPYLPKLLTGSRFLPQSEAVAQKLGDQYGSNVSNVVVNGPFKLEGWTGSELTWKLVKNADYWDASNVALNEVTVNVSKEVATSVQLFDSKQVQYTTISDQFVDQYKSQPTFHAQPKATMGYMNFNTLKPTTANQHFRRAIAMAYDKQALTNNVLKDGSIPSTGLIPKSFATNEVTGKDFVDESGDFLKFDVQEAQKEWELAKKELGVSEVTVTLLTSDTGTSKLVGEYLQAQIQKNLNMLSTALREEKNKTVEVVKKIKTKVNFKVGDRVFVKSINQFANILKINTSKESASVQAGILKLEVPFEEIKIVEEKKEKVYNVSTHKKTPVRSEIDLRGKMVDEGIYELETYLDRATLNGYTEVYVIHGKGTGALREGILKYLKTSKYVKEYRIGGHGEGGLGCTVVTLK